MVTVRKERDSVSVWTPERIKAIRDGLGLSQVDFAHRVGTDPGTVSRWETGRNVPRPKAVTRMLEKLERKVRKSEGK